MARFSGMYEKPEWRRRYSTFIERWLAGLEIGTRGKTSISAFIRNWLIETRGELCERCGWGERHILTGRVPIEVHHKDGNFKNNHPDNLQLLCPNCHSLTETFRSLNSKSQRQRRPASSALERRPCTADVGS